MNAVAYFQATIQSESKTLNGMGWVDGIALWGTNSDAPLHTSNAVLGQLEHGGLNTTAHKHMLYDTSIKGCGEM